MNLLSKLESILFVASKPLTIVQLAKALDTSKEHISEALDTLVMIARSRKCADGDES
ncbi:MAG: hypothetical protein UV18_C0004G0087 [Candidatus Magasanikbacteria bacterium GW2011_GWC2_42_27]|nr:MAG: hypothetical protein UV18_C0004G0087 [Candidatus Magasanikbacteria bacterium GW2011_GWC2_42_27]